MTLKTRKTGLLAAIAILLAIYIVQIFLANRSTEKTFKTKEDITSIVVTEGVSETNAILELQKKGDSWVAGKKEFLASKENVEAMIVDIKELKAVTMISRTTNESTDERYGFSAGGSFKIEAKNGEKTVRAFTIGKASPTGEQFYFKVDSGNEVYLSAKNLKNLFYMTDDEIREENIFDFEKDKIEEIAITNNFGVFKISRDVSTKNAPWTTENHIMESQMLSNPKVENLVVRLRNVKAENWNEGKEDFSPDAILTIKSGEKSVTLQAKKDTRVAVTQDFSDSFTIDERTYAALETRFEDLLEEKSIVQEPQNLN